MATPEERLQRLKEWAAERLKKEIHEGTRGIQARLSRAIDFTTAHIANVNSGKALPGDEMIAALGHHWRMSYDEMMAAANDEPTPSRSVVSDRVHHVIARVGQTLGYSAQEMEIASLYVSGLSGTSNMSDEVAADLLARARISFRDGQREATERIGQTTIHDEDDLGTSGPKIPRRPKPKK